MRELERRSATDLPPSPPPGAETLAIVGPGRVGGAIAAAAERAGIEAVLAGRDEAAGACRAADAVLLCVPDAAISAAAAAAAAVAPTPRLVGHVSGATGLDALGAARERGAATFSIHPLQTVPSPDTDLTGAPCAVAGSNDTALRFAERLAERLAMRPFVLDDRNRAAYHAAASIASNFLVALEESAAEVLAAAGVEAPRELLAPLVLRTAANWAEQGDDALTGPIARGDEATVARHREALTELAPDLTGLYDTLAERTQALARARTEGRR